MKTVLSSFTMIWFEKGGVNLQLLNKQKYLRFDRKQCECSSENG